MKRTTHLVKLLLAVILASVLGLGLVWYFVIVPARRFRRGDPSAIARMAQRGPRVIPDMLEGLSSGDLGYRRASRNVLYRLWEHLSPQERKAAAAGELAVRLTEIDCDDTRIWFRVEFVADIPGDHRLYGKQIHLFVNGNEIADFRTDTVMTLPTPPPPIPSNPAFQLLRSHCPISLDSDDSIVIKGRIWFGLPPLPSGEYLSTEEYLRELAPPHGQFTSQGFCLDWSTPCVILSEVATEEALSRFGKPK